MTSPKIAIVIVNWNNQVDSLACLDSLARCGSPNLLIIVVDNASTDGSVEEISARHPEITLIKNQKNLGFTGGNNIGLRAAFTQGAEYVLLLNNDTEVDSNFLGPLVDALEAQPQAWAAAPIIYYYKQPGVIWAAGGKIDFQRATADMLGTDEEDQGQYGHEPYESDYATGCALLVRRSSVEKFGFLDDRFFMYYEEVEWCTRMKLNGLKVLIVPGSKVWHKIDPMSRNESPFVHYLMTRNRLLWARSPGFGKLVFWRILLLDNLRTLLSWSLRPKWKFKKELRKVMSQAMLDIFRNRVGAPNFHPSYQKHEILLEGRS